MKLSDFFVPKWKHSSPEVRTKAVKKIKDISLLSQIAENDDDPDVRKSAANRLDSMQEHVREL